MEPWKVILLVAAVPTLIAAVLSGMNNATITEKQGERVRQEANRDAKQRELQETRDKLTVAQNETQMAKADTETRTTELQEAEAQISQKDLDIQEKNRLITTAETEIQAFDALVQSVGKINQLNDLMAAEEARIQQIQGELSRTQNQFSIISAKNQEQEREITARETEDKNRKLGIITKDISTVVKAAYNDWGFVIIDAGDIEGLVPNATLDVSRQGKPVCKLLVTEVEPKQAVADIIPSSLTPGQLVQVGDTVTKKGAGVPAPAAAPDAAANPFQ